MAIGGNIGKASIEAATKLAKIHGVSVLGWNDKVGKEFICFAGEGDKLQSLRKEMEANGWHAWPMEEAQEGHFLDFGLHPPADMPTRTSEEEPPQTIAGRNEPHEQVGVASFRFNGPSSVFLNNLISLCLLPIVIIWFNRNSGWDATLKTALSFAVVVALGIFLLPLHWLSIVVNDSTLRIRKRTFGKINEVAISEIKKIKIYTETSLRGQKRQYVGIKLKSGRAMDLFLPKGRQLELLAFIRERLR